MLLYFCNHYNIYMNCTLYVSEILTLTFRAYSLFCSLSFLAAKMLK